MARWVRRSCRYVPREDISFEFHVFKLTTEVSAKPLYSEIVGASSSLRKDISSHIEQNPLHRTQVQIPT